MEFKSNAKETICHFLETKKVASENTIMELAEILLDFAVKKEMTISNIRESVYLVDEYMEENAIVKKEDLNPFKSSQND